jgi:hypothetical protein
MICGFRTVNTNGEEETWMAEEKKSASVGERCALNNTQWIRF